MAFQFEQKPINVYASGLNGDGVFLDLLAVVDDYESCLFKRGGYAPGTFTIVINRNTLYASQFAVDRIIQIGTDNNKCGYITSVQQEEGPDGALSEKVTIKGCELWQWLDQRVTYPQPNNDNYVLASSTPVETVIKSVVSYNMGPTALDSNRIDSTLTIAPDQGRGAAYLISSRYASLLTEVQNAALATHSTVYAYLDVPNRKWVLQFTPGVDRTSAQSTNAQAVFTTDRETLQSAIYNQDKSGFKNWAVVAGQGQGSSRSIQVVSSDSSVGRARRELFVDARDLSDTSSLQTRGQQQLGQNQFQAYLTIDALAYAQLQYGQDYDLGDKVSVWQFGVVVHTWISSIEEFWGAGQYNIRLGFDKPSQTITTQAAATAARLQQAQAVIEVPNTPTKALTATDPSETDLVTCYTFDDLSDQPFTAQADQGDKGYNAVGGIMSSGRFSRTVLAQSWGASKLSSRYSIGSGARASGTVLTGQTAYSQMVGLVPAGVPFTDYTSGYMCHNGAGSFKVYELGALVFTGGAVSANDVLSVVYDGWNLLYQQNGVTKYTNSTIGPGKLWNLGIDLYDFGTSLSAVSFTTDGLSYFQDAWATVDGWNVGATGGSVSITANPGNLTWAPATSASSCIRGVPVTPGQLIIVRAKADVSQTLTARGVVSGSTDISLGAITVGTSWSWYVILIPAGCTSWNYFQASQAGTIVFDWIYVGAGYGQAPADLSRNKSAMLLQRSIPTMGKTGKGVDFAGVGYGQTQLPSGMKALSLWFKSGANNAIVASHGSLGSLLGAWGLALADGANMALRTMVRYGDGTLALDMYVPKPQATWRDGTWHHLVFGFGGGGATGFWVDGTRQAVLYNAGSENLDVSAVITSPQTVYGKDSYSGGLHSVAIDGLRAYQRALTDAEALYLYANPGGQTAVSVQNAAQTASVGSSNAGQVLFNLAGSNGSQVGGDSNLFWDNINKRLGIGVGNPDCPLVINQNATAPTDTITPPIVPIMRLVGADGQQTALVIDTFGHTPTVLGRRSEGSNAAKTGVVQGVPLLSLHGRGYDTIEYSGVQVQYSLRAAEDWSDTARGTYHSWHTTASGGITMTEKLRLTDTGQLFGMVLHNNPNPVTGATNQYIASGTYIPTLTNVSQVAASTPYQCQWIRVGNVVTVSGKVDVQCAGVGTSALLRISLPIPSTISAQENVAGTDQANANQTVAGAIYGDTTNNAAYILWANITSTVNTGHFFTFTYLIQ
jgi:hypothetical protein